jgi:uncharacterized membrane protein
MTNKVEKNANVQPQSAEQVKNQAQTVNCIVDGAVDLPTVEEQERMERLEKLATFRVTTDTEVAPEEPALSVDGVGLFALNDIHAVKAKQKHGKTTMLKVCAAALLAGQMFRVKSELENPSVLWLDTEQKSTDVKLIVTSIQQMTGLDDNYINSHLYVYALRSRNYDELFKDMTALVEQIKPSVVILDGIVEFVESFNDEGASKSLIHDLLITSEQQHCAVICVLHTNKSEDDHNMRGHLGTMLAQKAGTVLECKKQGKIINISCSESRHEEMPQWNICYNKEGQIVDGDEQYKLWDEQRKLRQQQKRKEESERKQKERLDYTLLAIRNNGGQMQRKQLTEILINKFGLSRPTISSIISQWLKDNAFYESNGFIHTTQETAIPF